MFDPDLLKSTSLLLQNKARTTIFVFDRSEFYLCFGEDAKFVAAKVFESNAFIKEEFCGDKTLPYITINKNQYQRLIRDLLLVHQYNVELYQNKGRSTTWQLVSKASPGNLQDFEDIFDATDDLVENAVVVALKFIPSETGTKHIALAGCDITNQRFVVAEFPDGMHFTALQALLVQLAPKEILLPSSERDGDYKTIDQVVRRFGVVTHRKTGEFAATDIVQDLNRLLKFASGQQPNAISLSETKLIGAMGCLSALIHYLKLLSDQSAFSRYKLEKAVFGQYMRLDANVVRALDLFDFNGSVNTKETLYGLLNRCRTGPGKRLLDQWIKMPLLDVNKINERLDIVEALTRDSEARQTLATCLSRFPDIQRILKSFLKKRATLQDLYKLYQAVKLIPNAISAIQKVANGSNTVAQCLLEPLQESQSHLSKLIEFVVAALDLDNIRNFEVYVKPSHHPELTRLKEGMSDLEKKIETETSKAAKRLGLEPGKTLKLEMNAQLGYHLRVTKKDEKIVREARMTVLDSNKSGVRFQTDSLGNLSCSYGELKKEYETLQEKIADKILGIAGSYFDPLQRLCSLMAVLDVLLSFATVSSTYVRPEVLDKEAGILELRDARHPCLETHETLSFIPNCVSLRRGQTEFLLITGPNMGGKSTYLRQTGLIVLMAQIGCFVPCSFARLSVVDAIFTRIGASDAQLEGASTFRMEMVEMAAILEAATIDSLILIDELGRGTSTYDGCSLAWSIAEHIATNIRGWCLFATHFHELTALDIDLKTVQNLHVTANMCDGQFTLLYQVMPGPCGSSFGLQIAKALNLPGSIIEDANKALGEFAWCRGDENAERMDCDQSNQQSMEEWSAASLVTQMKRILLTEDRPTTAEKAEAIRNLLINGKGHEM